MLSKNHSIFAGKHSNQVKRGIFFKKMLLIYTICTSIVFFGFSVIVSATVQRNYMKQIDQLNEKALFQSANTCSVTLENLYNYFYTEVLESPELIELLLADKYSKSLSVLFSRLNSKMMNYSNLVESCYVVNMKGGFVCSTFDTFKELDSFPDQEILEWLKSYQDSSMIYDFVPRKTDFQILGKPYAKKYVSLIFKKYKEGYFVINIDYGKFTGMVNYRSYNQSSHTLLMNSSGYVLADSNEGMFGNQVNDTLYYEKLWEQPGNSGRYKAAVDGSGKIVNFRKNEFFGISYITITDYYAFNDNTLLLKVVIYSLLAVFINLGFILMSTCFLYRPIGKLQKFTTYDKGMAKEKVDEFKMMEIAFEAMKKDSREYLKSKRKKVLIEILEDRTISEKNMLRELEVFQKMFNGPLFLVLNIYLDREERQREEEAGNVPLLKFATENILREQLSQEVRMELIDYDHYLVCILNMNLPFHKSYAIDDVEGITQAKETSKIAGLEMALFGLQNKMLEYFNLHVYCSVGNVVKSLFDLSESYRNALAAEFFQITEKREAILYFEELEPEQTVAQKYPGEQAKEILDAIKCTDEGKIKRNLPQLFGKLMYYNHARAIKCICMFEIELAKMEMKYDVQSENSDWELMEGIRKGINLGRIQELCLQRCLDDVKIIRKTNENNSRMAEIVQKVIDIVNQNIANPDLSVNAIAREVLLSTSYLRNIFKEVTGNTLSNYIIEKRLEQICFLLKNTKLSVNQIAEQMRFGSKSYLYTFFKNYMGMTPSQYREQLAENNIEK